MFLLNDLKYLILYKCTNGHLQKKIIYSTEHSFFLKKKMTQYLYFILCSLLEMGFTSIYLPTYLPWQIYTIKHDTDPFTSLKFFISSLSFITPLPLTLIIADLCIFLIVLFFTQYHIFLNYTMLGLYRLNSFTW